MGLSCKAKAPLFALLFTGLQCAAGLTLSTIVDTSGEEQPLPSPAGTIGEVRAELAAMRGLPSACVVLFDADDGAATPLTDDAAPYSADAMHVGVVYNATPCPALEIQNAHDHTGLRFNWMWNDAGAVSNIAARLNPGRWSGWLARTAAADELEPWRFEAVREVRVAVHAVTAQAKAAVVRSTGHPIFDGATHMVFQDAAAAVEFLRGLGSLPAGEVYERIHQRTFLFPRLRARAAKPFKLSHLLGIEKY